MRWGYKRQTKWEYMNGAETLNTRMVPGRAAHTRATRHSHTHTNYFKTLMYTYFSQAHHKQSSQTTKNMTLSDVWAGACAHTAAIAAAGMWRTFKMYERAKRQSEAAENVSNINALSNYSGTHDIANKTTLNENERTFKTRKKNERKTF